MRHTVRLIGIVILSLLVFMPVTQAQDTIQVGDTIVGTLNGSAAQYTITLEAGQVVIISLSSESFDSLIVVNDAMGTEVGLDDDGGEGFNSRLAFSAPQSGTFTILAGSYTPDVTGEYALSITAPEQLTYNTPATVELNGSNTHYFSFNALKDDVVNVVAHSGDAQLDTNLVLKSPSGEELRHNEDDGPASDPAILRFHVPEDGNYTLELKPTFDAELFGIVQLTVEATELALLEAGEARTFVIGDVYNYEILHIDALAGQHYRLTVTKDQISTNMWVNIGGGTALNTTKAIGGTVDFIAEGGLTHIEIRDSGYDGAITYTVAIETVNNQ